MKRDETRSDEQNRRMWAMLSDLSKQLQWPVDGEMQWLSKEDWKVIISAGIKRHQRVAKGIEGGFVMLGESTSRMTMKDFAEMIELMFAFGAEHGVIWSDPTNPPLEVYHEVGHA
jgi:NinB protein